MSRPDGGSAAAKEEDTGMTHECAHQIGSTFEIPIDELKIDLRANSRDVDRESLRELAESMSLDVGVGQLQAINVYWTGSAYAVATGFRRTLAMKMFREEHGFVTIRATRIPPERADLARLAENFDRENPST